MNPSDIQDFEKSEAAREAVKTIGELSVASNDGKKNVTQAKYILVRDFLLVQIFIDNANRPGVLSCMTMKEFNEMSEGDGGVISVMQHKTAHIHGPAHIVLSQKLKAWLTMFVKVIRPHVKVALQVRVFRTHVHARKSLNLSKINTNSNCLNKYKLNHIEN